VIDLIAAGIDVGASTTKAVIIDGNRILGRSSLEPTGFDQRGAAERALSQALSEAGLAQAAIQRTYSTGAGAKAVPFAANAISDVRAAARGANHFIPEARTVIDVGAEEGRCIRVGDHGRVLDFAINDKCAAGAGAFIEAMARALEIPLDEMGAQSLQSKQEIPINAQCVVFAESEVVSLIHANIAKQDIARAVHDAIANRIGSMVRRVGIEKEVLLVGGLARNDGFLDALTRSLKVELSIPEAPGHVCATGAALEAAEKQD
jgi:benzoyl-CoA reductase subunit D